MAFEPHKFVPYPPSGNTRSSCVKCGRAKDAPVHRIGTYIEKHKEK